MTALNVKQRKHLKGLAHHLKPVVTIGARGLTAAVIEELDQSIAHHELMKVKLPAGEKAEREALLAAVCEAISAAPVALVGRTGILFRAAEKSGFRLPR